MQRNYTSVTLSTKWIFLQNSKHRFGKLIIGVPLLSVGTKKVRLAPITIHDFFQKLLLDKNLRNLCVHIFSRACRWANYVAHST